MKDCLAGNKICLAASALLVIAAPNSKAQLVAYESFSGIPVGAFSSGQGSNSFGWNGPWTVIGVPNGRFQIADPTPDLSFQIPGGNFVAGGDRGLLMTTSPEPVPSGLMLVRRFPQSPRITTTLYFGFLVRIPISGTGSDSIDVHLLSGTKTVIRIPIRPNNNPPPSGYMYQFEGVDGESGAGFSLSGDNSRSHLFVVESLRFPGSGNEVYGFRSFLNPDAKFPSSPGGSSTYITQQIDGIGIDIKSADSGGPATTVIIDEIKIGYTWKDIVLPAEDALAVSNLSIENAVKLKWQTITGKTYQPQYSYDLVNWFNLGQPISGNNQLKEFFDSTTPDSKRLYRVKMN